jgi:hypothetical protein
MSKNAPSCLSKGVVLAYLHGLNKNGGKEYIEAILTLSCVVRDRQWELACAQWYTYTLWSGGAREWGVVNPAGKLRRVQLSYSKTHWHTAGETDEENYMPVISALNSRLSDIAYRYSPRTAEVAQARPNPKHAFILRFLYLESVGLLDEAFP